MGSQRGDGPGVPPADEHQLRPAVLGVHVEGVSRRLAGVHEAAAVGGEHHVLQVAGVLSRDLDDGFTVVQLYLHGGAGQIPSDLGPDVPVSELDAEEDEEEVRNTLSGLFGTGRYVPRHIVIVGFPDPDGGDSSHPGEGVGGAASRSHGGGVRVHGPLCGGGMQVSLNKLQKSLYYAVIVTQKLNSVFL